MQAEFRAIVQTQYGNPEKALKISKRSLKSEVLGTDEVLVKALAARFTPAMKKQRRR
jgi:NADPH:quinone reductase-like Zn-dependent oxidoreductase